MHKYKTEPEFREEADDAHVRAVGRRVEVRIQAKVAVAPPVDRHVSQRPERGQRFPLLIVAAAVDRRAGAGGELGEERGRSGQGQVPASSPHHPKTPRRP